MLSRIYGPPRITLVLPRAEAKAWELSISVGRKPGNQDQNCKSHRMFWIRGSLATHRLERNTEVMKGHPRRVPHVPPNNLKVPQSGKVGIQGIHRWYFMIFHEFHTRWNKRWVMLNGTVSLDEREAYEVWSHEWSQFEDDSSDSSFLLEGGQGRGKLTWWACLSDMWIATSWSSMSLLHGSIAVSWHWMQPDLADILANPGAWHDIFPHPMTLLTLKQMNHLQIMFFDLKRWCSFSNFEHSRIVGGFNTNSQHNRVPSLNEGVNERSRPEANLKSWGEEIFTLRVYWTSICFC